MTIAEITVSSGVAVLAGPRTSFLDHLAPLCAQWNIPLVCTDAWVATCAQTFYPNLSLICADQEMFEPILSRYSTFVTVEPCRLHAGALQFGHFLYRGTGKTVAGFHGNPAKFRSDYWIERYADEDLVLVYGDHLKDYLKEKGVWPRLKEVAHIGNIRKTYYEAHKSFFDAAVKPYLFPKNKRTTILWAPTWSYPHPPQHLEEVLGSVPDDFQIMVKLHPFVYRLHPETVAHLKEQYQGHDQVMILDEIPLVYPFLAAADSYLGDLSSVAYDFLAMNRPLFMLGNHDYSWATSVKDPKDLFDALRAPDTLREKREQTYRYVFSS